MRSLTCALLACLLLLSFSHAATGATIEYDQLEIWSLGIDGQPEPMHITLGQFANYLKAHDANISLYPQDHDLLEMRVTDPRMNLHEHIINTYVFELKPGKNRALCNHFYMNDQEMTGSELYAKTSFLFRLVAGQSKKFSRKFNFHIMDRNAMLTDGQAVPAAGTLADKDVDNEICGKLVLKLPLDETVTFILLDREAQIYPFFFLNDACKVDTQLLCARILKKIKPDQQMKKDGIWAQEMTFIHQCRPGGTGKGGVY